MPCAYPNKPQKIPISHAIKGDASLIHVSICTNEYHSQPTVTETCHLKTRMSSYILFSFGRSSIISGYNAHTWDYTFHKWGC